jgi:hypothetical protein
MTFRNGIWIPLDPDGAESEGGTIIQDARTLFADDGLFQFGTIEESSPTTDDAGIFTGAVDPLADTFRFVSDTDVGSTASNSVASVETSDTQSQDEVGADTLQGTSFAAIDWRLTPDYDDDPGWYPGVVWQPPTEQLASAVQDIVSTNPVLQDVAERASLPLDELSSLYPGIEWPPLLGQSGTPDEGVAAAETEVPAVSNGDDTQTATSSLTYADLSEQYPGIVWPADWYLL